MIKKLVSILTITSLLFGIPNYQECYAATVELFHAKMNDDAADTVVADAGSGANTGTLNGGDNTADISVVGQINDALDFDGTNDFVEANGLATDAASNTTGTFTAWVNIDADNDTFNEVCTFGDGTTGDQVRFELDMALTRDSLTVAVKNGGTFKWLWRSARTFDTEIGNWVHIVAIQDGVSPIFFIDGVDVTSAGSFVISTAIAAWNSSTTVTNFDIAQEGDGTNRFNGQIDDVRYFSDVLTSDQVGLIYNSGAGTESALDDIGAAAGPLLGVGIMMS